MRILVALLLSCASLLAADDIRVTTTVRTNAQSGKITTREVFTRGSQTNLLRITGSKDGVIVSRSHRFYYNRKLVAVHMAFPQEQESFVDTTSGFSVNLEFGSSNMISKALIGNKQGKIIDAYSSTNGILFPLAASELKGLKKSAATWGE